MDMFQYRTKNGSAPGKQPRVYFTCHPDDFRRAFDRICRDLFHRQDCTVWYTPDMTCPLTEADRETDLSRMNLFVIPVSLKLLTTPNRAMDEDFAFAKNAHIPVLPIMLEPGLESVYAQPEKFGQLQFLEPATVDESAISYEEKLEKYLKAVLISDKLATHIRNAFDGYIFLSYRKKDRRYANALMRLIHAQPQCRDIAIWYDEFLTPGECFSENILRMLRSSNLFSLVVTPNLLEDANYVMREEYPAACAAGMNILPVEMLPTNRLTLQEKFRNIPPCADPGNSLDFQRVLLEQVKPILAVSRKKDARHHYLMGLAYLDGVDVEVDRKRGLELVTQAAEAGFPEAIRLLYRRYLHGIGMPLDYKKAAFWGEKLLELRKQTLGEDHPDTLEAMCDLAFVCKRLNQLSKAQKLYEHVYTRYAATVGEAHRSTVTAMYYLMTVRSAQKKYEESLELGRKLYGLLCRTLGAEDDLTLSTLENMAYNYGKLGNNQNKLNVYRKIYETRCRVLGAEHSNTMATLYNLAATYAQLKQPETALPLLEKVYAFRCERLGATHPETLSTLSGLAVVHQQLEHLEQAEALYLQVYEQRCRILNPDHPDIFTALMQLVRLYNLRKQPEKAAELKRKTLQRWETEYMRRCAELGQEHPDTLEALEALAEAYGRLKDSKTQLQLLEQVYQIRCKTLGPEHPDTKSMVGILEFLRLFTMNI